MDFARGAVFSCCLIVTLAAVAPRLGPGPRVAPRIVVQPAPALAAGQETSDSTTAQPDKQAYTLPPDKLAKAIALGRIRNILGFGGPLKPLNRRLR